MKRFLFALVLLWLAVLAQSALAADTVYYYYTNTLHSAVVVTDAHGNVVERTYYAPYGQVLNRSMRNGPGYTGHEEDPATGLVYMQQRYYDPQSGRFLSIDPVLPTDGGANFNRYWYANDNPYRYTDKDGRESGGGYATGEYTMALPPSSPEARDAALTMVGLVPVVGDVQNVVDAYNNPSVASIAIAAVGLVPEAGTAIADIAKVAKVASAADRAGALARTMGKVTQTKVTIAVTETAEGSRIVSSSEGALRPATRAALSDGEIAARGAPGTHAEVNGVNAARQMGLTPTGTAASRPICPACAQNLEQNGVKPLSPLKREP